MKLAKRMAVFLGFLIFLAGLSAKGCALVDTDGPDVPKITPDLVWPSPPETPRIRYLRSISTPKDLGITKSMWRRIWEFVVGEVEESIVKPYGIEADEKGRIYVADSVARVIHVFDLEGKDYRKIGDPLKLKFPVDLAIDRRGHIFVSDAEASRVIKFDPEGKEIGEIGSEGNLRRPAGIAYNTVNNLVYVVDVGQHAVLAYEPSGRLRYRFGRRGNADGEFNFPTNITVNKRGHLYVTDSLNFRVQIFDAEGKFISIFGRLGDAIGDFSKPKGIALDSEGHIYVVEGLYDTVLIYDHDGRLLLNFGGPGMAPGQFWLASGIFIDSQDRIYVADSYNNRIQVFQYLKALGADGLQR